MAAEVTRLRRWAVIGWGLVLIILAFEGGQVWSRYVSFQFRERVRTEARTMLTEALNSQYQDCIEPGLKRVNAPKKGGP